MQIPAQQLQNCLHGVSITLAHKLRKVGSVLVVVVVGLCCDAPQNLVVMFKRCTFYIFFFMQTSNATRAAARSWRQVASVAARFSCTQAVSFFERWPLTAPARPWSGLDSAQHEATRRASATARTKQKKQKKKEKRNYV